MSEPSVSRGLLQLLIPGFGVGHMPHGLTTRNQPRLGGRYSYKRNNSVARTQPESKTVLLGGQYRGTQHTGTRFICERVFVLGGLGRSFGRG
jgi:hypothetical protein